MATAEGSQNNAPVLVVAGIRDQKSLGWSAANAWLEEDPNHEVVATVRSPRAQTFIEAQNETTGGRISGVAIDWQDPQAEHMLSSVLQARYGDERRVAGIVHAIAGADPITFTTPAHQLEVDHHRNAENSSTYSLLRVVRAARNNLRPYGGIVTYGFGEPGHLTEGYGSPMSLAKVALSQLVVELAFSLGQDDPPARTLEIVTGFIATRSGRGVALFQHARPRDIEERFAATSPLKGANAERQRQIAGELAVRFINGREYEQTTGARIPVDGGWSLGRPALF